MAARELVGPRDLAQRDRRETDEMATELQACSRRMMGEAGEIDSQTLLAG